MFGSKFLKYGFYVLSLMLIVFLSYNIVISLSRIGETSVNLAVIPEDATITINNKPVKPGSLYLKPGLYEFKASKRGWDTDILEVDIKKDPINVGLAPEPVSDSALAFLEDNPSLQLQREAIGGLSFDIRGNILEAATPLIRSLPYDDIYGPFSVDYGPSRLQKDGSLIQVSSSTPPGRIKFIEWLRSQGYDPTDLEIEYYDFSNPFYTLSTGSLEESE